MIDPLRLLPHNLRKRFVMRRLREQLQPRRIEAAETATRLKRGRMVALERPPQARASWGAEGRD